MHKQNIITPSDNPHLHSGFLEAIPVYQSSKDGSSTEDITMAFKDYDGNPMVLEYKASSNVMASIAKPSKPLTLSPSDPTSRAQCFEVFGMLNKRPSSPISTIDKMEAHGYAERVSGAISRSIQSAVSAVNSTPSPSPSKETPNE